MNCDIYESEIKPRWFEDIPPLHVGTEIIVMYGLLSYVYRNDKNTSKLKNVTQPFFYNLNCVLCINTSLTKPQVLAEPTF